MDGFIIGLRRSWCFGNEINSFVIVCVSLKLHLPAIRSIDLSGKQSTASPEDDIIS
jgi:hypothetical protein